MGQIHFSELEKTINYCFKNKDLLCEALTHSSYANEIKAKKPNVRCNERLEFLGDSVLSVIVSEHIFKKYSDVPEGELTQTRAALVQSQALAMYARSISLGDYLFLGHGEEKSNGRERQSTLENAFEALLAAIYLDAGKDGFAEIRKFLVPIVDKELSKNLSSFSGDFKTELQQLIQQAEGDFLEYVVIGESGPDHKKIFEVEARLNSNVIGSGKGSSKREAEQNAAKEALRLFGEVQ
jgi:ribonuclease-3